MAVMIRGGSGLTLTLLVVMAIATLVPHAESFMPLHAPLRSSGALLHRPVPCTDKGTVSLTSGARRLPSCGAEEGKGGDRQGGEGGVDGGERERARGGVAVLTKTPDTENVDEVQDKVKYEGNWRVLLHRDDWATMDYGQWAIMTVIPTISHKKAHKIALQAHMKGIATVTIVPKSLARAFSLGFWKLGFTSSIAPEDKSSMFE
uniref:Adaptor protein ClpS core domain-containing protein n=2 Tax=Hemiselmis andersenii TaxID=464988 RepID=A0A6U4UL17_HEMAN|mmetsp:Transcript_18420/g.42665  ORF Transcript_18420/g.42665 Transcript_18420/m.42665 type:complete len:204 (+) Transcript_18420:167-778(+)